jgi:hypothetical protein
MHEPGVSHLSVRENQRSQARQLFEMLQPGVSHLDAEETDTDDWLAESRLVETYCATQVLDSATAASSFDSPHPLCNTDPSSKEHRNRIVSPISGRIRTCFRIILLSIGYFGGQSITFNKLSAVTHPLSPSPVPMLQTFTLESWLALTSFLPS